MKKKRKKGNFVFYACLLSLCMAVVCLGGFFWMKTSKISSADTLVTTEERADTKDTIEIEGMADTENTTDAWDITNISNTADTADSINTIDTTDSVDAALETMITNLQSKAAGALVCMGVLEQEAADRLFYEMEIDADLLQRILGKSYTENETILPSDLVYLKMLHCGADGNTYIGEMIVNKAISDKVRRIFKTLYEQQYPIERMVLVDVYDADDEASMNANNTSAFNYRTVAGSNTLSNHSYGMAIDINPKYNPYVKIRSDGSLFCQPESGLEYADREKEFLYKIDEEDLAYQVFIQEGFIWGGHWNSVKDYQHFEFEEIS